jgi:hypothetical protein
MKITVTMVVAFVREVKDEKGIKVSELVTFNGAPPADYSESVIPPDNDYATGSPTSEMSLLVENHKKWGTFKVGDIFAFELTTGAPVQAGLIV